MAQGELIDSATGNVIVGDPASIEYSEVEAYIAATPIVSPDARTSVVSPTGITRSMTYQQMVTHVANLAAARVGPAANVADTVGPVGPMRSGPIGTRMVVDTPAVDYTSMLYVILAAVGVIVVLKIAT